MTIDATVEIVEEEIGTRFVVKTDYAGVLIGENGQNLIAFSHIVKKLVDASPEETESVSFSVDINDYQVKKIEELKELAKMNAQRVRYFKKEIEMPPMNSFERRVVHAALTADPDVETSSIAKALTVAL